MTVAYPFNETGSLGLHEAVPAGAEGRGDAEGAAAPRRTGADPRLIPGAVEELMRFVPLGAGAGFPRYAVEDVLVGDVLVRQGEPVVVAIGAANRDTLRFDDADELRVDRPPTQHLGFGHGVHHCLGAALARMELQEAPRALLVELPNLHVAGDIQWKTEMLVRSPITMPVGW